MCVVVCEHMFVRDTSYTRRAEGSRDQTQVVRQLAPLPTQPSQSPQMNLIFEYGHRSLETSPRRQTIVQGAIEPPHI